MTGKQHLFNIDFDEDQSEGEAAPVPIENKQEEKKKDAVRKQDSKYGKAAFSSTMIRRNLLCQLEQEAEYLNAIILPSNKVKEVEIQLPKRKTYEKVKEQQQQQQKEQKINHKPIRFLHQINFSSSEDQGQNAEEPKGEKSQQQTEIKRQQTPSFTVNPYNRANILDFNLEESSEEEQVQKEDSVQSEQSDDSSTREIKKVLMLKPNERTPITMKDIAINHDPFENMKMLCTGIVGLGHILNIKLLRDNSGINTFWPQYRAHMADTGAKVLVAKKMIGSSTPNYYITLESGIDSVSHEWFLGKMRGNSQGSLYHVFSKGLNPKKEAGFGAKRIVQATIMFKSQTHEKQPRVFEVFALTQKSNYWELQGAQEGKQIGLNELFSYSGNKNKIFHFVNRAPVYSEAVKGYILNFSGRVQVPSVKNFILEDSIAHRQVLMMGKVDDSIFRVDVSWPLKPYVALCICLTMFDSSFIGN